MGRAVEIAVLVRRQQVAALVKIAFSIYAWLECCEFSRIQTSLLSSVSLSSWHWVVMFTVWCFTLRLLRIRNFLRSVVSRKQVTPMPHDLQWLPVHFLFQFRVVVLIRTQHI